MLALRAQANRSVERGGYIGIDGAYDQVDWWYVIGGY